MIDKKHKYKSVLAVDLKNIYIPTGTTNIINTLDPRRQNYYVIAFKKHRFEMFVFFSED